MTIKKKKKKKRVLICKYLITRKVAFFSRASANFSAVRSVRPVLLRLRTSRRVLISRALNNLPCIKNYIIRYDYVS